MSVYYQEMMNGSKPNPDSVCRVCGHGIEDHVFLGNPEGDSQGRVGECTKPGCTCKKFQSGGEKKE